MRVVLYYDLLRFSPRSIDLFISMNISPPSLPLLQTKAPALAVCARPITFAGVCVLSSIVSALQWASAAPFASFRTSLENAQVLSPNVTVRESARVCVENCIWRWCWLGICTSPVLAEESRKERAQDRG